MAEALDGEIISIDSRQVYKELGIGTAKPSGDELALIPHHFISERSIHDSVSAGQFARLAEDRMSDVLARGKTPIVVGGSPMYIQALQYGLAEIPEISSEVRTELDHRLKTEGSRLLFEELSNVDPKAAETMDATKSQRIVRALEVYHGTGKPLSSFHQSQRKPNYKYNTFVLFRDRAILYGRINRRVDLMLESGLVKEVEQLLESNMDTTLPVLRTIGYQEVIAYLQGIHDYEEMVRLIKRNSRRYAKRQLTWFRRFEEYAWVDLEEEDDPLERILSTFQPN